MKRGVATFALGVAALSVCPARAQQAPEAPPSAEELIETARERHLPRGVRRPCPEGQPGEIVVCARDPGEFRVTSPTEDAIAGGRAVYDGVARAPDVLGLPPCEVVGCIPMGRPPPPIYLIDLSAIPEPLSPEDAARVFRADEPADPP